MSARVEFTVFTKPWKMPLVELAGLVKKLGFSGIELPVRPGYQIEPKEAVKKLPEAARMFADHGLRIGSVAGPAEEGTIAACGEAGVPIIRVMVHVEQGQTYQAAEDDARRMFEGVIAALEKHGVKIGVQNHADQSIGSMAGVHRLIEPFEARHVGAVLDFAHCSVAGESPALACDVIWDRLCLVNMKNCYLRPIRRPGGSVTEWEKVWCAGREGFAHWPTVATELKKRNYSGDVCLCAEYSDESALNTLVAEDLAFVRELLTG